MKKSTIQRQRLIADFIDSENVSSQNQLKGLLKKNNIQITQATPVSYTHLTLPTMMSV